MSVLSYLTDRASGAVLTEAERTSISTSISTLAARLNSYFTTPGDDLTKHFRFGSSTRGTILPRKIDSKSDIDYMIVFKKGGFSPQTYLDRLRRFVEQKYGTSELYQSSPTVVLELNHIKFDLVPALHLYGSTYDIPDGPTSWQSTNPNDFNKVIEDKNKQELYLMKPTIRLAKIWNTFSGYVFDSFIFERWICEQSYYMDISQKSYVFSVIDKLSTNQSAQWRKDKIIRAKEIVAKVRQYEQDCMPFSALQEVKKLIPE